MIQKNVWLGAILIVFEVRGWGGLPGILAQDYRKGNLLRIMVSDLEARIGTDRFDFYEMGLPKPDPQELEKLEGLTKRFGDALAGEVWHDSPYVVWLNPNDKPHCLVVADDIPYDPQVE